MAFLIDPGWSPEQTEMHRERWELQVKMDKLYDTDRNKYSELAKRYHELCALLDKDEGNC